MRYFVTMASLYGVLLFINLLIAHTSATYFIHNIASHPLSRYYWFVGVYGFFFLISGLFGNRMASSTESVTILKANLLALIALFSVLFVSKHGEDYSRFIVISYFLLNLILPLPVYLLKRKFLTYPWLQEKILVVCDAKGLEKIKAWFTEEETFGFVIEETILLDNHLDIPQELESISSQHNYYAVVVAIESASIDDTFRWIETLQQKFIRLLMLPRLSKVPLVNAEIIGSITQKGVAFSLKNNLLHPIDRGVKYTFDFLLSVVIIIALLPLLVILYGIILLSTRHNPIFTQKRIGKGGKPFHIYKFRTMRVDADEVLAKLLASDESIRQEWEREHKLKDDPRITVMGHFLRKTSLDELPQLYNVIRGEMSLVGPRPIVNDEIKKYGEYFHYFSAVTPGITGLWQVSGRNDIEYDERVQLDVWYVRNWSIDLDVMILIKTVDAVLGRRGSY